MWIVINYVDIGGRDYGPGEAIGLFQNKEDAINYILERYNKPKIASKSGFHDEDDFEEGHEWFDNKFHDNQGFVISEYLEVKSPTTHVNKIAEEL